MIGKIGIRREDKNHWERRTPLTPAAVSELVRGGVKVKVQPSTIRAYSDDTYRQAGAELGEDLSDCNLVLAVKEIPASMFRPGGAYLFFSHTIKGQPYNMAMLRHLMDQQATLFDYERITDEKGRRLVFFGWYAGVAGMVDTLSVLGRRLSWLGHDTPFAAIRPTYMHEDQPAAESAIAAVGDELRNSNLPAELCPFICGFSGYGNVSRGAQHIYDLLPVEEIPPSDLARLTADANPPRNRLFKVVFHEEHLVVPREQGAAFDLQEYYQHPERFRSVFKDHLQHLSALINGIYWTEAYPRLVTRQWLRQASANGGPRLLVIGDISCDIGGAIEFTVKATPPDVPAFTYDPTRDAFSDGVEGPGVPVMAVDNLPCELPREASMAFSEALLPLVPAMARTDFTAPTAALDLPAPIRRALILHAGDFTPSYEFMRDFLE